MLKKSRKVIAYVLAILTLCSSIACFSSISSSAAASYWLRFADCKNSSGQYINYQQSIKLPSGNVLGHARSDNRTVTHIFVEDGSGKRQNAFCIEAGVAANGFDNMSANNSNAWNNLSAIVKQRINRAMLYGYTGNKAGLTGSDDEKWLATQLIIWEFKEGYRDVYSMKCTNTAILNTVCANGANSGVKKNYDKISSLLGSFVTIPSFSASRSAAAPTIYMKFENGKYTATVTDTNNVLSNFNFASQGGITVTKSGNNITFSATTDGASTSFSSQKSISNMPSYTGDKVVAWGEYSTSVKTQNVVTGCDVNSAKDDPPWAYFKVAAVTRSTVDVQACKEIYTQEAYDSDDGLPITDAEKLEGWYFKVKSSKLDKEYILGPTDETGYTELLSSKLGYNPTEGTYTVTELGRKNSDGTYSIPKEYTPVSASLDVPCTQVGKVNVGVITNILDKQQIKIVKTADDDVVNGIYYQVTDSKGNKTVVGPTDEDGITTTDYLPVGKYTITELGKKNADGTTYTVPARYVTPQEQEIEITESSLMNNLAISFHNVLNYKIAVVKVDQEDNKPLAGAVFGIYDESEKLIETLPATNDAGKAVSANKYAVGTHYQIKEITPPVGYVLSKEKQAITIDTSGVELVNNFQCYKTTFGNKPIYGKINGYKVSDNGDYLAGADIGLFAADETNLVEENALQVYTTTSDGYYEFNHLKYGTYKVCEIWAPQGYNINPTVYTFKITDDNQTFTQSIVNTKFRGSIIGKKTDAGGNGVAGAVIGLYGSATTTFTRDTAISTAVTDSNGGYKFLNVEYGSYKIKEITAPAGYVLSDTVYVAAITRPDEIYNVSNIVNTKITGNVDGYKVDGSGNKLAGATIGVFKVDEDSFTKDTALQYATTASDGYYKFTNLEYGSYVVREISTPSQSYALNERSFIVTIDKLGETVHVENIVNRNTQIDIRVMKRIYTTQAWDDPNGKPINQPQMLEGWYFKITSSKLSQDVIIGPTDKSGYTKYLSETINGIVNEGYYEVTELGRKNSDGTYSIPAQYNSAYPSLSATISTSFGKTFEFCCENILKTATVQICKSFKGITADNALNNLKGTAFKIVNNSTNEFNYSEDFIIDDSWKYTTKYDGSKYSYWLTKEVILPLGDYTITETGVSDGFDISLTTCSNSLYYTAAGLKISQTLNSADSTSTVYFVNTQVGNLTITKKDPESNEPIKGTTYRILKNGSPLKFVLANGTYYYSNNSQGSTDLVTNAAGNIIINGLPYNDYTIQEVQAAAGYNLLSSNINITINSQEQSKTIYNTSKIVLPETGGYGTSSFAIAGILLIISVAAFWNIYKKDNHKKVCRKRKEP